MELLERSLLVRDGLSVKADTTTTRGINRVLKTPDLVMSFEDDPDYITVKNVCAPPLSMCRDDELVWSYEDPPPKTGCTLREEDRYAQEYRQSACITCSKLDPVKDCSIGTVTATSVYGNSSPQNVSREYSCLYNVDDLASDCRVATQYTEEVRTNLFGDRNIKWFDNGVMTKLCDKRGNPDDCPKSNSMFKDPDDGKTRCSEMMSCELCKSWALHGDKEGQDAADLIMDRWCRDPINRDQEFPRDGTKSDPACMCKNRGDDDIYAELQKQVQSSPRCWYRPCFDTDMARYMVDSTMRNQSCPSELCMVNWNFKDSSDIDIKDVESVVSCGINQTDADGEPNNWFDKNKKTIFIGVGGLVLLIGGLVAYKVMKK